jgi:Protein kinase domain
LAYGGPGAKELAAMLKCPVCATEAAAASRFCAACGAALAAPLPTTGSYQPPTQAASPDPAAVPPRFPPGLVLAGRYRIVTFLGKGGMGEVYRADDLALGQSVALKFLPAELANDPDRLARFRNEVRLARQVSHPHVCRVYDLAEADGQSFLTMEYLDGEDLAALLRRIGRLPEDKGVELARQLCAGLAAAHDRGIIHRDLKPQNVMLDGRGQVRIMDFGIARSAEHLHGTDPRAGTPAYMAPEQLAGRGVSVQSDLYALGLVLYEMFTGKKAFPARSRDDLARLRRGATPVKPSSHITGLNPAVERVILRCLEKDPRDRPRSALAVLAGLPGGDPLAAALAAGETPSPQMVADAEVEGPVAPRTAVALLALVAVLVAVLAVLADRVKFFRRVPFELSPEQMVFSARQALKKLGHADPPGDSAWGFDHDVPLQRHLDRQVAAGAGRVALADGRPAVHYFWYRQSPFLLEATGRHNVYGAVTAADPPLLHPGMATVFLDPKGRLLEFHALPAGPAGSATGDVDWGPWFEWAGLDLRQFRLIPPAGEDSAGARRAAWEGSWPGRPELPLHVEAAARGGRPVAFFVGCPGRDEPRLQVEGEAAGLSVAPTFDFGLALVLLPGCVLLAWRNLRAGRADVAGGWRLALYAFAATLAAWLLRAHHAAALAAEQQLLAQAAGQGLLMAGLLCLAYFAVEPPLRRRWPWRIVSWNRLLAGRLRDPLVGRDVLLGVAFGAAQALFNSLETVTCDALHLPSDVFFPRIDLEAQSLTYLPHFLVAAQVERGLRQGLTGFAFFFLTYLLCRREWLACGVMGAAWSAMFLSGPDYLHPVNAAFVLIRCLVTLWFSQRFGVLAVVVFAYAWAVLAFAPLTYDLRTWHAGSTLLSTLAVAGLAGYGFWAALAGRPLFAAGWPGDD